jgi:hypothetical protein
MSTQTGRGIVPLNGMAGAALGCGLFGILVAVLLGFAFVPFAVMAVLAGVLALVCGRRARSFARTFHRESKVAVAGALSGGVAMVLGVLGLAL